MVFSTDKLSTWMGAPPHHWKESEKKQMKNVHKCWKVAHSGNHDRRVSFESVNSDEEKFITTDAGHKVKVTQAKDERHVEGEELKGEADVQEAMRKEGHMVDEEKFLPHGSILRSRDGAMKQPENAPFKDYDTFINSCDFDNWRPKFDRAQGSKFLVETARGIVSKICLSQSRNQLRAHKGHVPFRKNREHITPLALVFQEIKQWCVEFLRTADPYDDGSFKEIKNRIVYIEGLGHKEVWGNSVMAFGQGIRTVGQDRMFRLFTSMLEQLKSAEEFCFRQYSSRSSREKLEKLKNTLLALLTSEMRLISGRFQLEQKLKDSKAMKLQPLDLLSKPENLLFVDFKNPANVLLYKIMNNPFVEACFTNKYETAEVKAIVETLGDWSDANFFCKKGASEPIFLMEKKRATKIMPQAYTPTAAQLKVAIRKIDSRTPVPDQSARVIARLSTAFENPKDLEQVIKLLMKCLAAIQDIMPSIYAIHTLWSLAGEGGDFTIYDNMREQVMRVMKDAIDRVKTLKSASAKLRRYIHKLCELKEIEIKKENMKKRKMTYKPNWVNNHRYLANEMEGVSRSNYKKALKRIAEIADDANNYSLTADQLNEKVREAKRILDNITGLKSSSPIDIAAKDEDEIIAVPINSKKKDKDSYIHSKSPVMGFSDDEEDEDMMFGANNNFGDKSTAAGKRRAQNAYESDEESDW